MNSGKTEFLGLIRSHPWTSSPLPPCHGERVRVWGPELKTSLNLPYLGLSHRHSLPPYVFLSSPGLMHTLPSHRNLHTSLRPYPPPLLPHRPQVPSGNTHPLQLCFSHSPPHTPTFTRERWLQRCRGGVVDVTEVGRRKEENSDTLRTVLVGCHFVGQILVEASPCGVCHVGSVSF